jgi:hypothetical protein
LKVFHSNASARFDVRVYPERVYAEPRAAARLGKTGFGRHENSAIKRSHRMTLAVNNIISRTQTENVMVSFENFVSKSVLQIWTQMCRW